VETTSAQWGDRCTASPSGPAAGAAALPTWPQAYALWAGERRTLIVPVTSPGPVQITVAWQGMQPAVALTDLQGGVVAQASSGNGPLRIEHVFTAQEVARGPVVVSGGVMVASPPVDAALAVRALEPLRAKSRAAIASGRREAEAKLPKAERPRRGDPGVSRARQAEMYLEYASGARDVAVFYPRYADRSWPAGQRIVQLD
jgi:hypothetical protein